MHAGAGRSGRGAADTPRIGLHPGLHCSTAPGHNRAAEAVRRLLRRLCQPAWRGTPRARCVCQMRHRVCPLKSLYACMPPRACLPTQEPVCLYAYMYACTQSCCCTTSGQVIRSKSSTSIVDGGPPAAGPKLRELFSRCSGALTNTCSKPVCGLQAFVAAVVQHCEAAGLALGSQWRTPHRNSGDWTRFRKQVDTQRCALLSSSSSSSSRATTSSCSHMETLQSRPVRQPCRACLRLPTTLRPRRWCLQCSASLW
jgi:hypothetical protein